MTEVTHILAQIHDGNTAAADELLPLVYDELRALAAVKMAEEKPGQTLQATALVHEAFVRLVDVQCEVDWNGRKHFFAAAAEAMRRILVEKARRKARVKHGGGFIQRELDVEIASHRNDADLPQLLAIHDALDELGTDSRRCAELVKLRYFLGFGMSEAAEILEVSVSTVEQDWRYAKAWLRRRLSG